MSLASQQIEAERRLRALTAVRVERAWVGLGTYDEKDVARLLRLVLPVVLGAQRSSALLTNAYIAREVRRAIPSVKLNEVTGAALRNGAEPADVYRRPFVTVWTALSEGRQWEQAVNAGMAHLSSTATTDVQLAMRATMAKRELDLAPYGYRRKADASACPFCRAVDGAYVKATEGYAFALHGGCGCGFEVLREPHRGAVALPDGTRIRAYQYGPLNDAVAVHEHGELGPVLADPAHQFTSL